MFVFIRFFLIIICLGSSVLFAQKDANEGCFYAAGSLLYHLEALQEACEESEKIHFSEENLSRLWSKVEQHKYSINHKLIKNCYFNALSTSHDAADFATAKNWLEALRKQLQDTFLPEQTVVNAIGKRVADQPYPNFDDNPSMTKKMRAKMRRFLIPLNHPLKASLDTIFFHSRVTCNAHSLLHAGLIPLFNKPQPNTFIQVVKHHNLPDVLIKLYYDHEIRQKEKKPGWAWLVKRCQGAENIRNLAEKKSFKYFCVPDKSLYPLPAAQGKESTPTAPQPVILVVTDMKLVSEAETERAWKNIITPAHLEELYAILNHGYASCWLVHNIPYTIYGKFACIDTEHPKRKLDLGKVRPYLSDEMCRQWDELVQAGGPP